MLAKVLMEGGRLFQRVGAVVCKEQSKILRIDACGRSRERWSDERVES